MKNIKMLVSMLMIVCVLVFLSACTKSPDLNISNVEKKRVALVLRMNSGYHWGTIKLGAEAAAREFNVDIDYAAPDSEEDVDQQIKLVDQALTKKVDALILAASDYEALVNVTEKAYDSHIPVVIIDSEVNTKKINSFIATDNYDAGKKAGNVLIDKAGINCQIAIMSFMKGTKNTEEREEGLESVTLRYPGIKIVDKEYCLSDTRLAYSLTKKIISENQRVDAIVAMNEVAAEGVAQAIDEMNLEGKVKIIAFDSTLQAIDYMEKGIIQAIIIQNPFSIGYLGVKNAVDAMNGKKIESRIYTNSTAIDKGNMYLPENQKLLFPFTK
jgi:ABC-type sugar transport system, periplasmic component